MLRSLCCVEYTCMLSVTTGLPFVGMKELCRASLISATYKSGKNYSKPDGFQGVSGAPKNSYYRFIVSHILYSSCHEHHQPVLPSHKDLV